MSRHSPLLELRDVAFAYPATPARRVLDGLNLTIQPGEIVALIGPSGCGKSTALNLLAGFLQPTRGAVLMNGQEVTGPAPERAVIFQSDALFPWLTLRSNVAFGPACRCDREQLAQVDDYLALVGLERFHDYFPAQLSVGMRQRAELARVLVNHGPALLLDEPFSSLDVQTRETMQELLLNVHARVAPAVVIVTHDPEEAIFLADRVLVTTCVPARLIDSVPVPLPRPRHAAMRDSTTVMELRRRLRQLLAQAGRPVSLEQECIAPPACPHPGLVKGGRSPVIPSTAPGSNLRS